MRAWWRRLTTPTPKPTMADAMRAAGMWVI